MISLDHPEVKKRFEDVGFGWKSKRTEKVIQGEILAFYRSFGGGHLFGLTYLGHPLTDEFQPFTSVRTQKFERGLVVYDPLHLIDKSYAIGKEEVYLLKLESLNEEYLWKNTNIPIEGELLYAKWLDEERKKEHKE